MNTEQMHEEQSFEIIQNMINTAKQEHSTGAAFYFVLWGLVVMAFSILTFFALHTHGDWQPWSYNVFLVGGIVSIIHSKRADKKETTKSWFDNLYMFVWSGVGICLGITWGFAGVIGIANVIPISLMVYGFASFITGGTIKYHPSLIGSIICFLCVIVALNLTFEWQNLVCAFAVLCAHVIPGVMMMTKSKGR
jgi:MFS family permease